MKIRISALVMFFVICSQFIPFTHASLIVSNSEFHGPSQYHDEIWTSTWGTQYNDESTCMAEVQESGDLIWGCYTQVSSSEIYGVINRVTSNGTLVWSVEITEFTYPIPKKIVVNSELNIILVATSVFETQFPYNLLYLLEFRLDTGAFVTSTLILDHFESKIVMDWTSAGLLCIACQVVPDSDHRNTNITLYNPETRTISNEQSIPANSYNFIYPYDIIGNSSSGEVSVLVSSSVEQKGSHTIRIVNYNVQNNYLVFSADHTIKISTSELLGFDYWNSRYYIASQKDSYLQLYRLSMDYQIEIENETEYSNVNWRNFQVFSNGTAFLVGSGINDFQGSSFLISQGVIMTFSEINTGFSHSNIHFFGNTSANEINMISGILLTSANNVYFYGQGQSYGSFSKSNTDAYLINFYNSPINSTTATNSPSNNPSQTTWMWIGIIGFSVVFLGVTIYNKKHSLDD